MWKIKLINRNEKMQKIDSFLIKNFTNENKNPKKRQLSSKSDVCDNDIIDLGMRKKKSKILSPSLDQYCDDNIRKNSVDANLMLVNDENSIIIVDDESNLETSASGPSDNNLSVKSVCAGEKKKMESEFEEAKDTVEEKFEIVKDDPVASEGANNKVIDTSDKVKEVPQMTCKESESFFTEESPNDNNTPVADSLKNVTPKSASKRRLTPKQLLKKQESEKKREAKEHEKMEKLRLRKEKEDKINQLKEERKRLKHEKEEIKKREKEEKEKKRLMEIELKNEEKRTKEEEKKAKEEEKRKREEAKEEEKRKRDEAKEEERKKKEAEKRKEEKAATNFASFFTPKRSDNKSTLSASIEDVVDSPVRITKFMPFEVKGDMRLAMTLRRTLELEDKIAVDIALKNQNCAASDMYIEKLKSKQHTPLSDDKTWHLQDYADDDIIIIESEVAEEDMTEKENNSNREKKQIHRPRAKLLQFHENQRPPYWGTWRKRSSVIGPRKPFGQDKVMFEYDIDSDDEWEEEEPGESLHGSDDEKESADEYEVDNEVFVPHGYLSDEEGQDEMEDMSPEAQKAKLKFLEKEFEAEMKEKTEKLKPRLIGCVWFNNNIEDHISVGSYIAELLLSRRAVLWDNVTVPIHVDPSSSLSSSPVNTPAKSEQNKIAKSNVFPESAIPSLIKLVHGNRFKHKFLVEEFYNHLSQNSNSISEVPSKKAISKKMREIAEWTVYPQTDSSNHPMIGRKCWYVTKEVRDEYGVLDQTFSEGDAWLYSLEVPRNNISSNPSTAVEQGSPVTLITKFTKILSQEERKKQLKNKEKPAEDTIQMATSSSSSEKEKHISLVSMSNQKCKKNRLGKRVRVNVMDAFIKAKTKKEKDKSISSDIETIELSP